VLFQKISILPPTEGPFGLDLPALWKFEFRFIHSFKTFGLNNPPSPLLPQNSQWPSVVGIWIFSETTQFAADIHLFTIPWRPLGTYVGEGR